jgi:hypothetical protein
MKLHAFSNSPNLYDVRLGIEASLSDLFIDPVAEERDILKKEGV